MLNRLCISCVQACGRHPAIHFSRRFPGEFGLVEEAVRAGRVVVASFFLDTDQWDRFVEFFEKTAHGVFTNEMAGPITAPGMWYF